VVLDIVNKYCDDILSGRIPAGIHLKNAVLRFINNISCAGKGEGEARWEFREDAVEKVVNFVHKLKHFAGTYSGKHFELMPWQMFIICNLYGFYNLDGTRRFQTCYLEMARKQGKTSLVAALSLYHLIDDGEDGGEILFTANSLDQARIGFRMVSGYALGYNPDKRVLKQRFKDIYYDKTSSFIRVLAADSSKLDGYNCSLGIVDEYHSAPSSFVRDVLRSSMGMRVNPLLITITTAGFDKNLPCYELRTVTADIISGNKIDESFFGVIYSLDEKDDWHDPALWIKANPNLDVTVKAEFIERQVLQAINSPSDEVGVKTKNLNLWCDSGKTWIADEYIIKATDHINIAEFEGMECHVGVDLSSTTDLTAVSYLFVKDDKYNFINYYYIPRDTLGKAQLHADTDLYREWAYHGYLKTTAGNVTDYDYITRDMLGVEEKSDIQNVFYDKYNANAWAIQCEEQGLPMKPFGQTTGNFNNATREFERLMLCGKVVLSDNPITRYCLRNVELRYDFNGNCKPTKDQQNKKVDGVIAMLQALAAYQEYTGNFHGCQIF
jgi:phage terminase large subunit-like protein